jgi:hypothetical protein
MSSGTSNNPWEKIDPIEIVCNLSQPFYEILVFLIEDTSIEKLLLTDNTTYIINSRALLGALPFLTGTEKEINAARHSIAMQRTLLVYELLNFIPNEEAFNQYLVVATFTAPSSSSTNESSTFGTSPKKASATRSTALEEDCHEEKLNGNVSSTLLSSEGCEAQQQYIQNIAYRYFYILSSIARGGHVKREVHTESGTMAYTSTAFPTIVRQRAANYLQDLVCMRCFTDYFMTSRYHINELIDLTSPSEGMSALSKFDWSRVKSLCQQQVNKSTGTLEELASNQILISTSPNQSHQLVVHVLSLLPSWKESVAAAVVPRPSSKKTGIPHRYIQLCRISGYLTKRGGNIATWKRRFAILENRKLLYYSSQEAFEAREDPVGSFEITVNSTTCEIQGTLVRTILYSIL